MNKQRDMNWLLCTALPKVLIFLLALPFVILIRIIRPMIWIRWIPVSERIGHGIGNIDVYLLERRAGRQSSKAVDIFYPDRPWKINRQLVNMWKRIIPLYDFVYWIAWANWGNPILVAHYYNPPIGDRDIYGLSNDTPPPVSFTNKEEEHGANCCAKWGFHRAAPSFVFTPGIMLI